MASSGQSLSYISFDDANDMAALTLSSPHSIEKGKQRALPEENLSSPGVPRHGSDDEDGEWEINPEDYARLVRWNSSSTTASSSSHLAHPPATKQIAQASFLHELGFHPKRKNSVDELASQVEEFSKRQRIKKDHDRVKKRFRKGVNELNEKSDKPAISLEGAEAYYIENYAMKRTRLPADLTATQKARKEDLAKRKLGSDATVAEFEREYKKTLVKQRLGPDATTGKLDRDNRKKLAKQRLGPNATVADLMADYKRKRRERAKNAMDSSQQSLESIVNDALPLRQAPSIARRRT